MTKEAALWAFWSGFGLHAFEENSVPTDPVKRGEFFSSAGSEFPYITYQLSTGSFGESIPLTASIWDRDRDGYSAGRANNAKANEISRFIGRSGIMVDFDGGSIWIQRGSPFSSTMSEPSDDKIKRKVLNISAEFISAD